MQSMGCSYGAHVELWNILTHYGAMVLLHDVQCTHYGRCWWLKPNAWFHATPTTNKRERERESNYT